LFFFGNDVLGVMCGVWCAVGVLIGLVWFGLDIHTQGSIFPVMGVFIMLTTIAIFDNLVRLRMASCCPVPAVESPTSCIGMPMLRPLVW
jgi:hypothetical protein